MRLERQTQILILSAQPGVLGAQTDQPIPHLADASCAD
jgi:hypothetical protein